MTRDTLFLLAPGFYDNSRREYCPECAEVWGLLSYFPSIKESMNIIYQPIEKPRKDIVFLLGDKNQNCPTLVLSADSPSFENCGIMKNLKGINLLRVWFRLCWGLYPQFRCCLYRKYRALLCLRYRHRKFARVLRQPSV